jgi:ubiquitin carboxyl-terminal hydrolase L5
MCRKPGLASRCGGQLSKTATCLQDEWLSRVGQIVGERIALYSQTEIKFNLMALVKDRRPEQEQRLKEIEASLQCNENDTALKTERFELQQSLQETTSLRERWRIENVRRKHNYIPLLFNILQVLAERDELMPLLQAAKNAPKQ